MSLVAELKRYGVSLPVARDLEIHLPIEWPWLMRNAGSTTPRLFAGALLLEYLEQHPEDRGRPLSWMRQIALRASMLSRGWRNPEHSVLYKHLPETELAWIELCGVARGQRIVDAARLAGHAIQVGYPFHLTIRRVMANYALDYPVALDATDVKPHYLEMGVFLTTEFTC